ncbi:penicillin acylase family protein [bacterium]|nr:MAG: penicillin acylase family protein [bacterium]
MKSKAVKALVITVSVVVALVLVCVIAFQVFFRLPQPSYSGTEKLDGLTAPVEVRTDDHGIPHIFAQNEEDLFFTQGYITARERMFQMDLTRLAGRGELSLLLGETMVKNDKFFKTLGFHRAAEAEYSYLTPEARAEIDAYTRGVNYYINTAKFLPCEYVILGSKPQPWKPEDSLASGILMAYKLNMPVEIKPILYHIYTQEGPELLKYLLPWIPESAPMVSSNSENVSYTTNCNLPDVGAMKYNSDLTDELSFPISMRIRASSWIILSGARTTTGKSIFAASPDLEATIPALFYLVHLKGGDYDVIGGSIPGTPGVQALGFNGHFAWSVTNGRGDNTDFFVEKLNPDNPDQYMTEDGYKDFNIVQETLKIKTKNGIREEKLPVKISRHGPIISDVMSGMPANCTMMWPGLMGHGSTIQGLLALDRAKNFDEFRKALSVVRGLSINVGYADLDGNIGYQYIATFPIRKSGDNPIPVPGENGTYDWVGYLPFEDHPFDYNPAKGYLASFNQMPKPADYYGTVYFLFERPYRFQDIINSKDKFSLEDIRQIQLDTISNVAKRWVPNILRVCDGVEGLSAYVAPMKNWDCSMSLDSSQATLFNSFLMHLTKNTFENKLGQKLMAEILKGFTAQISADWLIRYMDDNSDTIWDDISTANVKETRDDMILKSMKDAVAELTASFGKDTRNWAWGKVHAMTIKHPLGGVLPFLNLSPIPQPGDDFTIYAGWWDRQHPYNMISGATIRMIVDMSNLDNMTMMSPPGQSGLYLSPYYSDLAGMWAKGQQIPAHYTSAKELKQVLILEPLK